MFTLIHIMEGGEVNKHITLEPAGACIDGRRTANVNPVVGQCCKEVRGKAFGELSSELTAGTIQKRPRPRPVGTAAYLRFLVRAVRLLLQAKLSGSTGNANQQRKQATKRPQAGPP